METNPLTFSATTAAIGRRLRAEVKSFHEDEDGLTIVEQLLILAVSVIILAGLLMWLFPNAWQAIRIRMNALINSNYM